MSSISNIFTFWFAIIIVYNLITKKYYHKHIYLQNFIIYIELWKDNACIFCIQLDVNCLSCHHQQAINLFERKFVFICFNNVYTCSFCLNTKISVLNVVIIPILQNWKYLCLQHIGLYFLLPISFLSVLVDQMKNYLDLRYY